MSNLNDFLGPVFKTKNIVTTKTSSSFNLGSEYGGGPEITDFTATISNVQNSSVIIRLNLSVYYGNGSGDLWLLCFRNTIPAFSYSAANRHWDRTDEIFSYGLKMKSSDYTRTVNLQAIDVNPGVDPTYKFTHIRNDSNGANIVGGGTVKFSTNPLHDLTV